LDRWMAGLPEGDISFVFQNMAPFAAVGRGVERRMLAGAIARLAWEQARHPAALDANYVRQSDAEMAWTEK